MSLGWGRGGEEQALLVPLGHSSHMCYSPGCLASDPAFPVPTTGPPAVSLYPQGSQTPAKLPSPGGHLCLPPTPPSPLCTPTVRLHSWPWPPCLPVPIPAPKETRAVVSISCILSVWESCQDYCSCKLHNPPQQAETLRTRLGPRLELIARGWDPRRPVHSKAASNTTGPLPLSCRGHTGYFGCPFKTGKCPHTLWPQSGHEAIADPSMSLEG